MVLLKEKMAAMYSFISLLSKTKDLNPWQKAKVFNSTSLMATVVHKQLTL